MEHFPAEELVIIYFLQPEIAFCRKLMKPLKLEKYPETLFVYFFNFVQQQNFSC